MVNICGKLGDEEKGALAKKSLSLALVKSGKEDEAPNRLRAVAALERAMAAAERKSETDFKKWWFEAESLGGISDKDIKQALDRIREHGGPPGFESFLRDMGVSFANAGSPDKINQFTKRLMYVVFRTGGIQYGPRYQCVSPYRLGDYGGKSMAHLQPSSQSDSWEYMVGYHTGILDGALQSGAVVQAPNVY